MAKNMLIDATHKEEVRVAVVDGKRLVEFDYESKVRKQIKGGVFLAKVTRIEPSLQAAFVNYGGNRHGFLPFSEIHPDYFRIPVSDREALIAAQKAELEQHDHDEEEIDSEETSDEINDDPEEEVEEDVVEVGGIDKPALDDDADIKEETSDIASEDDSKDEPEEDDEDNIGNVKAEDEDNEKSDEELDVEAEAKLQADGENQEGGSKGRNNRGRNNRGRNNRGRNNRGRSHMKSGKGPEIVDDGDGSDKPFRFNLRHKYKIQEVIKRGQIMLIQVSKEERGNKGAAVTSYISLPGRYCVLMPNSPRGGGVSRKIGNFKDRKRMREILKDLTIPEGMSVILRTAGVSRTKAEIKRDLDYLTRLWNTIREDTLKSSAPALINEEGNLIKRSIRDLYTRDIDNVYVAGESGYKTAKEFMKMLVPSHAKKVQKYDDTKVPLFHKYNVEKQISEIGEISVQLKSGGSLVINPTEALVSIDVNSGKATKERHIEETALKTNLEAAEEVARQLRLRDLGGLVVIDFIDMMERRNNRKVENKLRDALSSDRARIQVGRISSFGLLELSRQRLNPSLTEAQFETCPECSGRGTVKTLDFAAITAIRAIEEIGIKGTAKELSLSVPNNVAVYILNNKRKMFADIEERYDFRVHVRVDDTLFASDFRVDILAQAEGRKAAENSNDDEQEDNDGDEKQRRGRRRGRRGGRRRNNNRSEDQNNQNKSNKDHKPEETSSNNDDKKPTKKKSAKKTASKKTAKKAAKADVKSGEESVGEEKKPTKKTSAKSSKKAVSKKSAKKTEKKAEKKEVKPSNDVAVKPAVVEKKDYEVVNAAPEKKKKGWWNKLVE